MSTLPARVPLLQAVLEPAAVKFLDEMQRLATGGNLDELAKHGEVYVRRTA